MVNVHESFTILDLYISWEVCLLNKKYKNIKVWFYLSQYPVRRIAQSALHFPPGRPVHSDTNSTSLGSIQPGSNYERRLFTHIPNHCLSSSTHLYSLVDSDIMERKEIPKLQNSS